MWRLQKKLLKKYWIQTRYLNSFGMKSKPNRTFQDHSC